MLMELAVWACLKPSDIGGIASRWWDLCFLTTFGWASCAGGSEDVGSEVSTGEGRLVGEAHEGTFKARGEGNISDGGLELVLNGIPSSSVSGLRLVTNDHLSKSEFCLFVNSLPDDNEETKDKLEEDSELLQAGGMSNSFSSVGSSGTFGGAGNS